MNKDFILPDIGEGIVECEVLEWKVKEGDLVEEDQVIADVSTDKAIVEIPSMHSGRVTKLYYIAGETAKVHSPLYAIDIDGEDVELPNQEIETQEHKLELVKQPTNVMQSEINNKVLTTPAVRKLAREHDLDLNLISGSGKSGRILKEDVLEYLKPDLKAPLLSLTKAIEDRSHNIGMAVDGKTGLLVPNIKDVQQRSIIDIAHEVTRLTDAARSGVINPADLKDGTITISNIGAIGGISASPIINKPEVAIVALGKIQKLPRFNDEGQLEERHIITMSWSGDHRVIDGATIARFSNSWKAYLENPSTMLANMV